MPKSIKSHLLEIDARFLNGHIKSFYAEHFMYRGKAYLLTDELFFPPHSSSNKNVRMGPEDQLLAVGGDLTPERIILAFKNGIYPSSVKGQPILWWTSEIRCVLFTKNIHISKVMWRLIKHNNFHLTIDSAFNDVVNSCAEARKDYTWLTPDRIKSCCELHDLDYKHSVEVWQDGKLVAGLFGFTLGSYFYISSMFTRVNHASKFAMIALAIRLEELNYSLLDCGTWPTDHLKSMGAVIIQRDEFLELLNQSIEAPNIIESWKDLFENWDFCQAVKNHIDKNQLDPIS
nr:leucyl/phenylalanyl-tRNA--protein transferase [uncultured Acetobacterium sp.]